MRKLKKLWMPALLGALLMATFVGVAGAKPNARPEASPALVNYMISYHHCIGASDTDDYTTVGGWLECRTAVCRFHCPIKPPHEGVIRVQRLAAYLFDNGANDVCILLAQIFPKTGTTVVRVNNQCTTDDAADPQVYSYNPANFKVSVLQDLYVFFTFNGTTQKVYGAKLRYEPL